MQKEIMKILNMLHCTALDDPALEEVPYSNYKNNKALGEDPVTDK
jgi:hypothetical protein